MKFTVNIILIIALLAVTAFSQTTEKKIKVTALQMPANSTVGEFAGDMKDGQILSSLRWAEQSNVACFPGTRFEMFNGNHVFYLVTLPAAASMIVTVTPKDNAQVSLYALRQGTSGTDQSVPPNVKSAISCEASYPIYANLPGGKTVKNKDDGTRKIEYTSVGSAYSILIGVAGAKGATDGEFTLKVEIKNR
jgi:hypothetical protein